VAIPHASAIHVAQNRDGEGSLRFNRFVTRREREEEIPAMRKAADEQGRCDECERRER
jgi:hypothetical protein